MNCVSVNRTAKHNIYIAIKSIVANSTIIINREPIDRPPHARHLLFIGAANAQSSVVVDCIHAKYIDEKSTFINRVLFYIHIKWAPLVCGIRIYLCLLSKHVYTHNVYTQTNTISQCATIIIIIDSGSLISTRARAAIQQFCQLIRNVNPPSSFYRLIQGFFFSVRFSYKNHLSDWLLVVRSFFLPQHGVTAYE